MNTQKNGFTIEDNEDQFVFVEFVEDTAYLISKLHDAAVTGACSKNKAEAEALRLMGIPYFTS